MNIKNSTTLRGVIATAIFSALGLSFAAVGAAANDYETVAEIVKYGDLNIANPEGAAALYHRIVAAANHVCGTVDTTNLNFKFRASINACVRKAVAEAVTKVGQPALFAIYNSKNRQPLPITVASAQSQ